MTCRHLAALPRLAVGALLAWLLLITVPARADDAALCLAAIARAEAQHDLPSGLLHAIALTETGRAKDGRLAPWPWSVNIEGAGFWFETREEAIRAVRDAQARGKRSIDIGCLQINLRWHPEAFASVEAGFVPTTNAGYAARLLRSLRERSADWLQAAGRYHSWNDEFGVPYRARVAKHWDDLPALSTALAAIEAPDTTPNAAVTPRDTRLLAMDRAYGPLIAFQVADAAPPGRGPLDLNVNRPLIPWGDNDGGSRSAGGIF